MERRPARTRAPPTRTSALDRRLGPLSRELGSEGEREAGGLVDCSLGVQLGDYVGAADQVDGTTGRPKCVDEIADRLLTGTHDDGIDGQHSRPLVLGAEGDVQAVVVDAFVV